MERLDDRGPGRLAVRRPRVELDDGYVESAGRRMGFHRLAQVSGLLDLEVGIEKLADADPRDGVAIHNKASTIIAQTPVTPS